MKQLAFVFICTSIHFPAFTQTLFTVDKTAVTKAEFESAFNKNPAVAGNRKKALREYLDLYINFKLKVHSAYSDGISKDATQQYELENFRRQSADNYINEEANIKKLVKESFERSQKQIHLAQVFVEAKSGEDSAIAYKKIQSAYKALKNGQDFSAVATEFSTDEETRRTRGDLGYITAFTLPYHLENIAYSLKINTFSSPVKTKMGYHIFKNVGEKQALGMRRVAQILVTFPPNPSTEELKVAATKADSLYNLVIKGASFGYLARAVSHDLSSSNNNGELPPFSPGTYSPEFEEVAFSLKETGEVSKPFKTSYGYHLLQLLEVKPVVTDPNDLNALSAMQEKVAREGRMEKAKKELIQKKLPLLKYTAARVDKRLLFPYTDSALVNPDATRQGIFKKTPLFSFGKQNVTAGEWVQFVKAARSNPANAYPGSFSELFKEFIYVSAAEHYRNNLEKFNKDFARQVTEFKEANLLFAVMEKNVWAKANNDSAGLQKYYAQHKSKYRWLASADAIIVTCSNAAVAKEMQEKLKDSLQNWREITASKASEVTADSGRFELSQLPVIDRTNFTAGLITAPVKNENDGSFTFNYVINLHNQNDQRSFDDARGLVINDYQEFLEDVWLRELKKKFPVKVNEAVFNTIK
ncbi:MAG TPA: peptidylprolyl isomerase [Segetibacter sp.]